MREREEGKKERERKRNPAFRFENRSDDILNTSLKKKNSRKSDALSIHNALAPGHRGVCVYYFSWKRLDLLVFRNSWKDQAFAVAAATPGTLKTRRGECFGGASPSHSSLSRKVLKDRSFKFGDSDFTFLNLS